MAQLAERVSFPRYRLTRLDDDLAAANIQLSAQVNPRQCAAS